MSPPRLRVVHLIDSLGAGGAARLEVTFAKAARNLPIELTVASLGRCASSNVADIEANGARIVKVGGRRSFLGRRGGAVLDTVRLLRRTDADVLQSSLAYANIVGCLAGLLTRTPVVAVLHATIDETARHSPRMRAMESRALRYVPARVIGVGGTVTESHAQRLSSQRLETVPNAVEPGPVLDPAEGRELRARLAGGPDRQIVMCVGRLVPQKALPDLIAAFDLLHRSRPDVVLVLVGDGSLRSDVEEDVRARGLDGVVRMLGDRADVQDLLQVADVFATASHWEGLPLAVLEAMAAGLAVVATAVGELPRLLAEGRGVTVPPGSPRELAAALVAVLDDEPGRSVMGALGAAYVREEHSPSSWAGRLERIYREVSGLTLESG